MDRTFKKCLIAAVALCCGSGISAGVAAQESYPSKTVRLVVPFAPGGGTDVVGRSLAKGLGDELHVQFIVDNKSGAGGVLGTDSVAKAPADGYTLLFAPSSHVVNPAVLKKLPYSVDKNFEPVSMVASATVILGASAKLTSATSLKDFIAEATRNAGQQAVNYGSSGNGTPFHLISEQFKREVRLPMQHIPYRGGAPAAAALVGGEIPILFETAITLKPFIQSGQVLAYAVMSPARSPLFPDVPTIAELGYPDLSFSNDYALYAPAGTPQVVVKKLAAAAAKVVRAQSMSAILIAQGAIPVGGSPEELKAYVAQETKRWKAIADVAQITLD